MTLFAAPMENLIEQLSRLPGVGPKTAQRLAMFLLSADADQARELAEAIIDLKEKIRFCRECFNISEGDLCLICSNPKRDDGIICVVEEPRDVAAVERTGGFRGKYHVLGGAISPIDGVGPDRLRVKELLERVKERAVREVILATNPNAEGEATAMYLAEQLKSPGTRVSRIASGLPVGADLEYADEVTLGKSLEGRREL